jgi:3'-phosphoadenosine 5'-phosphosulfate sulfotransferase (PAPS reductase)/FAD synthetase
MSDQIRLLPAQDPDALIERARAQYNPIASFCLFSGGHDSSVLAHRCREHYDTLVFIDTGTAAPGVRAFVEEFAGWLGKPLKVYEAGEAFRALVLELGGFPGPAGHGRAYTRLKERQIEALVRDAKAGGSRMAKVMLLTGKRRAESARRAKTTKGIEAKGGQLYVNPLLDWTSYDMRRYRVEHQIPESDMSALFHRSMECTCCAFLEPGEREMMESLLPEWFDGLHGALEREAEAAGVRFCRLGGYDVHGNRAGGDVVDSGQLCSTCEWRQMGLEEAA